MSNPKKLAMRTQNLSDENYKKLAELFPNAVTETIVGYEPVLDNDGHQVYGLDGEPKERAIVKRAIDKDILEQEINTHVVEGREERYQFTWPDKRKSILLANAPITATLRPVRDDEPAVMKDGEKEIRYTRTGSVNFDNTENLYIEGDNLDVLKLLRETYLNRVKMIYIDPPYNTGNDFVYEDDFAEDTEEFLRRDGQYDEQGNRLVQNRDSNGRFHTDWLNMMYPRLRLARDLLTEDGVLIISISDAEFNTLKSICDEIFGMVNYCGDILWNSTKSVTNTALISVSHTYNLVYFKNLSYFVKHRNEFRLPDDGSGFENPDNDPRGPWKADPFQVGGWRPNQQYVITNPNTGVEYRPNPGCSWKNDYNNFQKLLKDNRIVFGKTGDGGPQRKRFIWEAQERGKVAKTWWDDVETTTNGTQLLKKMFNGVSIFNNPKPVGLLKKLLQLSTNNDSIILDFFSGSATTAHAVMQLNAEDGGKRKFIMVQIPEPCPEDSEAAKAGYKNICEIGKERIRRAGKKIKEENKDKPGIENLDIGFRVLKLDSSNMKDVYYTPEEYAQMNFELDGFEDNIKEDRTDEDLLFQVMLDLGIPLSAKIRQDGRIFYVEDNYLIACFDKVDMDLMTKIAKKQPYYAVFRDSSFSSDSALANFEQVFNTYSPRTERRVL
jgi:adenine-specific DNA-methyltransferase